MYYIVLFHFRTRSIFWRWCWWCHAIPSLLIQQDKACNFQASCIKHIVTKMTQNILANSILIWFYKKWFFVISTLVFWKYVCTYEFRWPLACLLTGIFMKYTLKYFQSLTKSTNLMNSSTAMFRNYQTKCYHLPQKAIVV